MLKQITKSTLLKGLLTLLSIMAMGIIVGCTSGFAEPFDINNIYFNYNTVSDSDGKYIGIDSDNEWSFVNIQCFIKNDEQKSQVMDMTGGDTITIRGKYKDVGEVLGYTIDIESIE